MGNQRIAAEHNDTPEAVVRWMGAMQAQDYHQALWAIGLRTESATMAQVEQAIATGKIVLTWLMRGTLHVAAPADVQWMRQLFAPRLLAASATRRKQLALDDGDLAHCHRIFEAELRGGNCLSRSGMMRLLQAEGIATDGQRGYHILWHVALSGLICFGPPQGKEQTFVLLDEWVTPSRDLDHDDALAELARRYFASHGPAMLADFAGWAGITLTDARTGFEAVRPAMVSEQAHGKAYWYAASAAVPPTHDRTRVDLLPGFDEYLLGYKDRGDVLRAEHADNIVPGGNGIFFPTIVVDGQVVGTWKRALKRQSLSITLHPFQHVGDAMEHTAEAAQRFSDFVGLPFSLKSL